MTKTEFDPFTRRLHGAFGSCRRLPSRCWDRATRDPPSPPRRAERTEEMPVVAYLPAPLAASLRRALPRARVAESWHELLRLVSVGHAGTAVVDPATDEWKTTDALLELHASYPSL